LHHTVQHAFDAIIRQATGQGRRPSLLVIANDVKQSRFFNQWPMGRHLAKRLAMTV